MSFLFGATCFALCRILSSGLCRASLGPVLQFSAREDLHSSPFIVVLWKRLLPCSGALGPHLTDQYLSVLFTGALEKLQGSDAGSSLTYVQLIASLRQVPFTPSKLLGSPVT